MNPLAQNLNEQLKQSNPEIFSMLSDLGQNMFYPKVFFLNLLKQRAQSIMQQLVWQPMTTVKCMPML